jgi:hypothetical protein
MVLKLLVFKRPNWWVVQCLNYDIAAQARGSMDDVISQFERMWRAHFWACKKQGVDPLDVPKAPDSYWTMFETAEPVGMREQHSVLPTIWEEIRLCQSKLAMLFPFAGEITNAFAFLAV